MVSYGKCNGRQEDPIFGFCNTLFERGMKLAIAENRFKIKTGIFSEIAYDESGFLERGKKALSQTLLADGNAPLKKVA